jgi:sugar phosphate isomerase/epimerase
MAASATMRRMKLHSSLLSVGLLFVFTLPGLAADKRDGSASEKIGMKISLQCYTYRALSFFETVDKAAAMGIRYLEIYPGQKLKPGATETTTSNMSDATCDAIKQKLASAGGLKLVAYGVAGVPTDEAGARRTFEWAKKMGIEVLVTETVPNAVHDKLCQEYNIRFALHNHPKSWPPDEVLKACTGHCQLIGSCSDTGHWMRRELVPVDTLKKLAGRIEHLHFKDLNAFGTGHDSPWGTGQGNAKAMLAELNRQGFKGYLSIEYETGGVKDLDENLPKCIAFFDQTVAELAK